MITATLGALQTADAALTRLSEIRLPIKTAYRVGKLLRAVRAEVDLFEERRAALVRELGDLQVDPPGSWKVLPAHMPAFVERITELAGMEVEIAADPIVIESLGDVDITPLDLLVLEPLLTAPVDLPLA